jgi:hypothetical protein
MNGTPLCCPPNFASLPDSLMHMDWEICADRQGIFPLEAHEVPKMSQEIYREKRYLTSKRSYLPCKLPYTCILKHFC